MTKKLLFISAIIFFAFLAAASGDEGKTTGNGYDIKKKSIEIKAPVFNLMDISGTKHSLSDYKGKTVLLFFTTTWCPHCKKDIPNLKKIHAAYRDSGLEIIAIYIQESQKKVHSFATKYDLPYTILLDTEGLAARAYGIRGVPTKVLIDKNGTIQCWACRSLEVMLEELLGKGM